MYENTREITSGRRTRRARLATGMMAALVAAASSAWAVAPALVPVGDPGNAPDATGFGAVANAFRIGTYEVTRAEYAAFLNAVAASDPHGLYNPNMGITRSGVSGSYQYAAVDVSRPVAFVSWYDALRYANWLNNGQLVGAQNAATTEDGAYAFSSETVAGPRKAGALVFLPTDNEWYKAAYYQGGGDNWYWKYPTRSDTPPLAAAPPGDDNTANYDRAAGGPTAVGAYGAAQGFYGTYDQAGNLWEWTESALDGERVVRGGSYHDYQLLLDAWYRDSQAPVLENEFVGFRVAAIEGGTEPPPPPPSQTYVLTVQTGSGDGSYTAGTVVTIVADPAPVGQIFDRWTGDIGGVADPLGASTTVTIPAAAVTITATYKSVVVATSLTITRAEWRQEDRELRVRGKGPAGKTVAVFKSDGTKLGTGTVKSDGTWNYRLRIGWSRALRRVRVTCNGATDEMAVTPIWDN